MSKPRINVIITREGGTGQRVRSFSLPAYFPRLAMVVGALLVIVIALGGFGLVYFWQRTHEITPLRAENAALRQAVAKLPQLEAEMDQQRQFTRRIARMIGIQISDDEDSVHRAGPVAVAAPGRSSPQTESLSSLVPLRASDTSGLPASLAPHGTLVINCSDDPHNRPRGMPVLGRVSQTYAPTVDNPVLRHYGIDIAAREGSPVFAPAAGTVVSAGWDKILGMLIVLDHGNGFKTFYGHNSELLKKTGDNVKRADIIALSGNSGISTAPHLHYEIRLNEETADPALYLGP